MGLYLVLAIIYFCYVLLAVIPYSLIPIATVGSGTFIEILAIGMLMKQVRAHYETFLNLC